MICAALKRGAKAAMIAVLKRQAALRHRLLSAGAARGRCLVLCYHRIAQEAADPCVVQPIPPGRFAEHMQALRAAGDIVPVASIIGRSGPYDRPTFAVTLDDDDLSHVSYALPILHKLGIPATFFLSGRSLHGLGPYWWNLLERSVEEIGLKATAQLLGYRAATAKDLARACRHAATVKELYPRATPPVMRADDIRTLAQAGMTIGFHTVHHQILPRLADAELIAALCDGRDALSSVAGTAIELLAYPYGRTDSRVAEAARRAGYAAAFGTGERPIAHDSHRFLLTRWQPGAASGAHLIAEAALRVAIPDDGVPAWGSRFEHALPLSALILIHEAAVAADRDHLLLGM